MLFEKGQKILFIGDSITDCGRARPVGEGLGDALGAGYVADAAALLGCAYPELALRVVNMGTGGHQARDLAARWQSDVLDLAPDWVVLLIGINDVWRRFDSPRQVEQHVRLSDYRQTLQDLIATTLPRTRGMVLMSPFYLEPNREDAMRRAMDAFGQVVRELAAQHNLPFVDAQAAFDGLLAHYYPASIAWDRVHPNHIGSMCLARAFLAGVGFDR